MLLKAILFFLELLREAIANLFDRKTENAAFFEKISRVSSRFNKGFSIGGSHYLSVKDSCMHLMCAGGSGAGKSATVVTPSILNAMQSMVINDVSGELFNKTAGCKSRQGFTVQLFDYNNPQHSSARYNPLHRIRSEADAHKISSMLVKSVLGSGGQDAFWNNQAASTLSLFMNILRHYDPQYLNFSNVKYLVEAFSISPKSLDLIVVRTKDQSVIRQFKSVIATEPKVLQNILSTCKAALTLWGSQDVQLLTATDTLDFASFRKHPTALYIRCRPFEQDYYSVITSMMMTQFFDALMQELPDKRDLATFFILDEFSSLKIPSIQLAISNLRKYRSAVLLAVQDVNQMKIQYDTPTATAIMASCYARIYFGNQPLETCRELEALLGKAEIKDKKGNTKMQSLLSADSIRALKKNHALIFCGSHRGVYHKMQPYYRNLIQKRRSTIPPPVPESASQNPDTLTIPLIPLP